MLKNGIGPICNIIHEKNVSPNDFSFLFVFNGPDIKINTFIQSKIIKAPDKRDFVAQKALIISWR